jgi:o-succinylbenzoate synthase
VELSIDDVPEFEQVLGDICANINECSCYEGLTAFVPRAYPSILFGLQTAWLDLANGGQKLIFKNDFVAKSTPIPINGLVWMNTAEHMLRQAEEKLQSGYSCIKFKVGAIDFEEELYLIQQLRAKSKEVVIRLDANGAWTYDEAVEKMSLFAQHGIHSIEQPIKAGQVQAMAQLCAKKIIDVALDEELIGWHAFTEKADLLKAIKPQYIILKPTLLGGFGHCDEWIWLAENQGIGWWNTSALESNIGLNAICQYSFERNPHILHGLGTGMLYANNIPSPLTVSEGGIWYDSRLAFGELN